MEFRPDRLQDASQQIETSPLRWVLSARIQWTQPNPTDGVGRRCLREWAVARTQQPLRELRAGLKVGAVAIEQHGRLMLLPLAWFSILPQILMFFNIKTISLTKQARDKHRIIREKEIYK